MRRADKRAAKLIASRILREFRTCKYIPTEYVIHMIGELTSNPRIKKESFNQIRRAWDKLEPIIIRPGLFR